MGCWRYSRSGAALGSSPISAAPGAGPGLGSLPGRSKWLCQVSCGQQGPGRCFGQALQLKITKPTTSPEPKALEGATLDAEIEI